MDSLVLLGILLILLGFAFITIGAFRSLRAPDTIEAGGVVLLGPLPIVFGTSPRAAFFALLFALLVVLWVVAWILWR